MSFFIIYITTQVFSLAIFCLSTLLLFLSKPQDLKILLINTFETKFLLLFYLWDKLNYQKLFVFLFKAKAALFIRNKWFTNLTFWIFWLCEVIKLNAWQNVVCERSFSRLLKESRANALSQRYFTNFVTRKSSFGASSGVIVPDPS